MIRRIRGGIPINAIVLNSTGKANKGYREICSPFSSDKKYIQIVPLTSPSVACTLHSNLRGAPI